MGTREKKEREREREQDREVIKEFKNRLVRRERDNVRRDDPR